MTIQSPNTRFQGGVFVGNIVVEANGFTLYDATVEGNIYYASQEYQESAEITDDSEVTGTMEVRN
jgi:sucrose-6-phosphate hydrolase SacC (GH32 family)